MKKNLIAAFAATTALAVGAAQAATFTVTSGQNAQVPSFDTAEDQFLIDTASFGFDESFVFLNSLATGVNDVANIIVLQDADDDNDPTTVFNARSAARLIGANTDEARGGFFIYFNSALNINRLVYSTDLSDGEAGFQIVAAILDPTGAAAIAALPGFSAANFDVAPVPLPGAAILFGSAIAAGAFRRRAIKS